MSLFFEGFRPQKFLTLLLVSMKFFYLFTAKITSDINNWGFSIKGWGHFIKGWSLEI